MFYKREQKCSRKEKRVLKTTQKWQADREGGFVPDFDHKSTIRSFDVIVAAVGLRGTQITHPSHMQKVTPGPRVKEKEKVTSGHREAKVR
jgi:hypothetical protein